MQRIGRMSWAVHALFLIVVVALGGAAAWPSRDEFAEDKRARSYDFGLGKRSMEEPASYEASDLGLWTPSYDDGMDKRAKNYAFGLGKRAKTYGFGLGKRLEHAWKANALQQASLPSYRQVRRSKIYSFGLGKRSGLPELNEDYYDGEGKRSYSGRQFAFGLGKREVSPAQAQEAAAQQAQNTTS